MKHFFTLSTIIFIASLHPLYCNMFTPESIEQLAEYLQHKSSRIAVLGAGYSQGGQTKSKEATQINMQNINKIVSFNQQKKLITVQSGATWREVQQFIDPFNLSVQVMQSYNDFTVGGSISVNVHGRDLQGQIITTVRELSIMLSDGSIVKACRDHNYELFRAVIGGYGLIGIIIDVTLQLADNVPMQLFTHTVDSKDYKMFFENNIRNDSSIQLHNAVIYPHDFTKLTSYSWKKSDKKVTVKKRLRKQKVIHAQELFLEQLVRRLPFLHATRPSIEQRLCQNGTVLYRNYEMSHTVKSIKPLIDFVTISILQEYFIPIEHFESFIKDIERIKKEYYVNIMNISVRFVPLNQESFLSYAPKDCFAFVLYIDVFNPKLKFATTQIWTKKLVDAALSYGGTYYLPYARYATKAQFQKSYPHVEEFLAIKKQYDLNNRFVNKLWQQYMQ